MSAGQSGSGMPMGASACSMARASSNGGLRQSSIQMNSPSSSPVLFEAAAAAASAAVPSSSRSAYPRHGGSAPSLPGSVVQSVSNSPARAVSVDEAASLALANLLEIDETQSNGGQNMASASATRRYQHALSVRVPPNQHGTAASASASASATSGAIPRRQSRSSVRSQNQSDEN